MASAQNGQRRGRRAQYDDAVGARRGAAKVAGERVGRGGGFGADDQRGQPAVGRPVAGPAHRRLAGHEGFQIAVDQRVHDRVFGRKRLQQHQSRRFGATGAARDLMQQLHRALGGPQVATGQAEIGVHHANQSQMREMPAFGDDLGADDQIDFSTFDSPGGGGGGVWAGHRVAGHDQAAGVRKKFGGFLGDAFHPGSDGGQRGFGLARRAFFRDRHRVAAMMAAQFPARAVFDQPGRAIRTLHPVPAAAAQRQRRIAAPVEEQHRLLAPRDGVADRGDQFRGEETAAFRRVLA